MKVKLITSVFSQWSTCWSWSADQCCQFSVLNVSTWRGRYTGQHGNGMKRLEPEDVTWKRSDSPPITEQSVCCITGHETKQAIKVSTEARTVSLMNMLVVTSYDKFSTVSSDPVFCLYAKRTGIKHRMQSERVVTRSPLSTAYKLKTNRHLLCQNLLYMFRDSS